MNLNVATQIARLAFALLRGQLSGSAQSEAALAQTLSDIVRIAAQAYRDHVGEPIDPSLIKAETPLLS